MRILAASTMAPCRRRCFRREAAHFVAQGDYTMHCALKASLLFGFIIIAAMLVMLEYLPVWLRFVALLDAAMVATIGIMLEETDHEA